jgi:hypothetical protein
LIELAECEGADSRVENIRAQDISA